MLPNPFKEFIELLEKNEVKYLVVGGYAVAAHGYPRYTGDLDIFVAIGPDQAKRIITTYREFGFTDLGVEETDFLQDDMIVEIGREPLKIQVMTGISGVKFEECYPSRKIIEFSGKEIPFISFDHLILNKSATKRGKDKVDVEELEKRKSQPDASNKSPNSPQ